MKKYRGQRETEENRSKGGGRKRCKKITSVFHGAVVVTY